MARTILDALKGINAYPVPLHALEAIAERRGVWLMSEADARMLRSKEFNLAKADALLWLSLAPSVAQGGQSYSFTEEQRRQLKAEAHALYAAYEDADRKPKPVYGYKGSRL